MQLNKRWLINIKSTIGVNLAVSVLVSISIIPYIAIALEETDSDFYLIVKDNGIGFPENFNWQNSRSLGLKIVKSLVTQIDGSIEINSSKGTEFIIKFPKLQNHNIAYS